MPKKQKQEWVPTKAKGFTRKGIVVTRSGARLAKSLNKMLKKHEVETNKRTGSKQRFGGHAYNKSYILLSRQGSYDLHAFSKRCVMCRGRQCAGNGWAAKERRRRERKKDKIRH